GHQILDDASRFMEHEQLDLSLLYAGPRKFYEAKGWHGTISEHMYSLSLDKVEFPGLATSIKVEEVQRFDGQIAKAICDIRTKTSINLTFVVERNLQYFERLIKADLEHATLSMKLFTIREPATNNLIGYFIVPVDSIKPGKEITIAEARMVHDDFESAYLALFKHIKETLDVPVIKIRLSPNYDICKIALKHGATDQTSITSGAMLKFISLERFFTKLALLLNQEIKDGKRTGILQSIKRPESIVLAVFPEDAYEGQGTKFRVDIKAVGKKGNVINIVPESRASNTKPTGTLSISEEMIVTLMFSPALSINEAVEEKLVRMDGVEPGIVELIFKGFTWDKETRDYF
nr:hypothetical protein [Candidatus Sigynarchaeota archaeon]